jgi:Protein of unknown function (DUF3108)
MAAANANAHTSAKTAPPAGGDARVRVPPSHGLDYDIQGEAKGLGYSASGSLRWRHDGAAYDARLEIKAFLIGSRVQTSVGHITPAGLSPTRFGDKARSEQAAHFVRAEGKVVFSANTPSAELSAGAQDRLSVLVQLGALVGAEPERYPAGTRLSLQTVSARESEIWDFVVGERKALALPGGTLDAIRLTRQPRRPFDQTIDVWLAPALDYLPARVRITQPNGDWAEQSWRQTLTP